MAASHSHMQSRVAVPVFCVDNLQVPDEPLDDFKAAPFRCYMQWSAAGSIRRVHDIDEIQIEFRGGNMQQCPRPRLPAKPDLVVKQ
ncbi:hypothetical protein PG994_005068 [Apiospora phragmitis]|uniref:Uncharacterized protein n=1 Tax=Apiospora phragmitis TaxID=2905665 RepID=A0ABR1VSC8_9PEZI